MKKEELSIEQINQLSREELKQRLTKMQVVFCHQYIQEWDRKASYRKAYPNCKKDSTAYSNAERLLRNAEINAYIDIIRNDIEEECGISKIKLIKDHMEIVNDEKVSIRTRQTSMREIKDMLGYNKPIRIDHTTKGEKIQNTDLSMYSYEELRAIAKGGN